MAELVDELQAAGYLERRPDRSDGRAKLSGPPARSGAPSPPCSAVGDIERVYAEELSSERFAVFVDALAILGMPQHPEREPKVAERVFRSDV